MRCTLVKNCSVGAQMSVNMAVGISAKVKYLQCVKCYLYVRLYCHIIPTTVSIPQLGTTGIHRRIHSWYPWSVDYSNDVMVRPQVAAKGHYLQIRLRI